MLRKIEEDHERDGDEVFKKSLSQGSKHLGWKKACMLQSELEQCVIQGEACH